MKPLIRVQNAAGNLFPLHKDSGASYLGSWNLLMIPIIPNFLLLPFFSKIPNIRFKTELCISCVSVECGCLRTCKCSNSRVRQLENVQVLHNQTCCLYYSNEYMFYFLQKNLLQYFVRGWSHFVTFTCYLPHF